MNVIAVQKTQGQLVREHLEAGKPITLFTALLVYGISRLSSVIERLRREGMEIDMALKEDEAGKQYGEYTLRRPIALGSRVQVRQGHGYGLPYWVLRTASAKVVGLIGDVAYVQFHTAKGDEVVQALNVKELVHVG